MFINLEDLERDDIKKMYAEAGDFSSAAKDLRLDDRQLTRLIEHIMNDATKDFMIAWQTAKNAFMTFKNGQDKDADIVIEDLLKDYLAFQQKDFQKGVAEGRIRIVISGNTDDIADCIKDQR